MEEKKWMRRDWMRQIGALGLGAASSGFPLSALAQGKFTIGIIYVGAKGDYGYNQAHAESAALLKKLPGVTVIEEESVPETQAVQRSMQGMISQDGAKLILPTSYGYFDPHVLAVAKKNPSVRFAHCGGLWTSGKHPSNVGSYFGYIDEGMFLNGVIAAHTSKSKKLGFIAAKPIPQVLRNINAFTLGAQSVNPAITTTAIFTGDWSLPVKEAEATNSLADQGVDVITMHVDSPRVIVETAAKRGKWVCGYHANQSKLAPQAYLTGAEWSWAVPTKMIVQAALSGKPHPNFVRGGLKEGFIKTSAYGPAVSAAARKNADAIKAKMMAGKFDIFTGEILDNQGRVVNAKGKSLRQTAVELESMNYLVKGVIGKLPI